MSRHIALIALGASALLLAGCSTASKLNPFAEKDAKLSGERRPVFAPGSDFAGPRKLPPPNSDYVGATMPANQVAGPAVQAPPPPAPGTSVPTTTPPASGKKKQQMQVPEAPPLPQNPR